MPMTDFDLILRQLALINWTGPVAYHIHNEPTLLGDHLIDFVAATKSILPKSKPYLFTNGDNLTVELAEKLILIGLWRGLITNHNFPSKPNPPENVRGVLKRFSDIFSYNVIYTPHSIGGLNPSYVTESKGCQSSTHTLVVRIDGGVGFCCGDYEERITYGNLLRGQGVMEIWHNPLFEADRARLRRGDRYFYCCKGCTGCP